MCGLCPRIRNVSRDRTRFQGEPGVIRPAFLFYRDGRDPAAFDGMRLQPPSPPVGFLQARADIFQAQPARLRMIYSRLAVIEESEMNGPIILASAQDENARVPAGIPMSKAILDQGMEYHGRNALSG